MNVEKSIQLDNKITLLVTDPAQEQITLTAPVTDLDAAKLLKDLSVDEFFDALDEASSEQLQTLVAGFEGNASNRQKVPGLFDATVEPRTEQDIFAWWEFRRLPFNVIIGSVGSVFLLYLAFSPILEGAVTVAFIYAAFANICYSSGAPTELFIRKCTDACFKKAHSLYGPLLLKLIIGVFVFITVCGGLMLCLFRAGGI